MLIQEKNDENRSRSHPEEKGQYIRHSTHFAHVAKSVAEKERYCIMWLFSGGYQDKGKHSNGKCQRDFVLQRSVSWKISNQKACIGLLWSQK